MKHIVIMSLLLAIGLFLIENKEPVVFIREVEATTTPSKAVLVEVIYTKEDIIRNIKEAFPNEPRMVTVAKCESGYIIKQVGRTSPDYGLFQINAPSWDKKAKELGYPDYKTDLQQNIKMAKYILEHQGISAWNPSRYCWGNK
jgi:Transglycosylase-like domain